ncbi:MAG: V-type ATPase 116kDa subunit family protein, partial [Eubacteriales bacterium]
VFENVNFVLLVAIGIGVTLVIAAILLNIVGCIKRRCFGEALLSQNGLCGLLLYVCGANLASGFMGGFSPLSGGVCGIVIAVCAVILIIKEPLIEGIDHHRFRKPESMVDFLLQNIFEFVEYVLSYMSNTVSFLRVGAFVLVHAGMMMVVFSLAGANENPVVIILGNVLVIALEGLLTGIQALRLEYYEMFSRFYIGDGRKFTPVRLRSKSTGSGDKLSA